MLCFRQRVKTLTRFHMFIFANMEIFKFAKKFDGAVYRCTTSRIASKTLKKIIL